MIKADYGGFAVLFLACFFVSGDVAMADSSFAEVAEALSNSTFNFLCFFFSVNFIRRLICYTFVCWNRT